MFPPGHTTTFNQTKMTEYFLLFLGKNAGENENSYSTPLLNSGTMNAVI
jgi:predicted ribosome quality control (RQC) complex YloA/Tae2 family protein